jgi:predicted DNA-binding transcriptional regulator AlpA
VTTADDDELILTEEAAQIVRLPAATLRYFRHAGKGPRSFRLGRRVVYKRSDLRAWIQEQYEQQAQH